MSDEEWELLPYRTDKRLPLTGAIPMFFRWKIANLKLMLADIVTLRDKYNIKSADLLYDVVHFEVEDECARLAGRIDRMKRIKGVKEKWLEAISLKVKDNSRE